MDEIATPEARSPSRTKTVQEHIDELPDVGRRHRPQIDPHDGDAVADLGACRHRQVL